MRPRITSLVLLVALASTAWIGGDRAAGFGYFSYGGITLVWPGAHSDRYLSPTTFPPGEPINEQMLNAMGLWVIVPRTSFTYAYGYYEPDYPLDHGDGYNDTIAVPAELLDPGVLAVTTMVYDTQEAVWLDMDTEFSDFPAEVGWNLEPNPPCWMIADPITYGVNFMMVATHEMGHALGLDHDPAGSEPPGSPWSIAIMNPIYPGGGPLGSDNILEVHADDRRGVRYLYPGPPETMTDLANANFCSASTVVGAAVPIFINPPAATPGQQVVAQSVVENFGTTIALDFSQGFYVSDDEIVDTDDLRLGYLVWDLPVGAAYEFGVGIAVPDLAAGYYYLGSMLDEFDDLAEEYEDNNNVVYCDPLVVVQAAPVIAPLSQQVIACDAPFIGPTPQVPYPVNMAPITWSLDNPQPGMTIDPDTGVIHWPEPIKSPFIYELDIRATNDAGAAVQTLELAVHQAAPAIVSIPPQTTNCGAEYMGPMPELTASACMDPITSWGLITGPPGMTINPNSGQVFWPDAQPSPAPHQITIRAINATGQGLLTWLLDVEPDGDLNLNGYVDLVDFGQFQACLDGPEAGVALGCACADLDMDDDVDLADFAKLTPALPGPG